MKSARVAWCKKAWGMFVLRLKEEKKEECERSRKFIFGFIAVERNLFLIFRN